MPVVQNWEHLALPPLSTEIWLQTGRRIHHSQVPQHLPLPLGSPVRVRRGVSSQGQHDHRLRHLVGEHQQWWHRAIKTMAQGGRESRRDCRTQGKRTERMAWAAVADGFGVLKGPFASPTISTREGVEGSFAQDKHASYHWPPATAALPPPRKPKDNCSASTDALFVGSHTDSEPEAALFQPDTAVEASELHSHS